MRMAEQQNLPDRATRSGEGPRKFQTAAWQDAAMNNSSFRVRPAVRRAGGKGRLLKYLLPLITPHTCYCEPFAGGLAVLLARPRSEVEVLNDKDGDLIRFYRCVRFHPEALLTELEFVLNSRREFLDARDQPGLTDIQRAARWYFRNRTCFGGVEMTSFGTSALSAVDSRGMRMEAIRALSVRLDRTLVEELDWAECIRRYDRPTTFFFCDPPYTDCGDNGYGAWTEAIVMKLREALAAVRGRWLVTLNDSPSNRRIFAGCEITGVERSMAINSKVARRQYREIIIHPAGQPASAKIKGAG
jgi:DNA adenine methylase